MLCVELTPNTAIIGHDGWADTNFGDYSNSNVVLSDHYLIEELIPWFRLDKANLRRAMTSLAAAAAEHFQVVLEEAASKYRNVIAITHVPPFREASSLSRANLRRRLPPLLRLQDRRQCHAAHHGPAPQLQFVGPLWAHAQCQRHSGIGQPARRDGRSDVRQATDQLDLGSRIK